MTTCSFRQYPDSSSDEDEDETGEEWTGEWVGEMICHDCVRPGYRWELSPEELLQRHRKEMLVLIYKAVINLLHQDAIPKSSFLVLEDQIRVRAQSTGFFHTGDCYTPHLGPWGRGT